MASLGGHRCERAHEWLSLRADGELSQLERLLLETHLDGCPDCRVFADAVDRMTALLRSTTLERPQPSTRVALPRRRGARLALRIAGAAAAFAMVALGGSIVVRTLSHGVIVRPTAMVSSSDTETTFRNARRQQLIAQALAVPRHEATF